MLAANEADEIEHAEAATHARHATGGQHVVRSGDVVPRRLGRELVQEDRARVLHSRSQRRRECEMFRCDVIRRLDGPL